jgi:hypothetical protein
MTNQPDEDDRILKRLTVEFDQDASHEPLMGSEFLLLVLGGAPRAGRYQTEMHRPDGTVEIETRVVNETGRTIKRESTLQPSSSREKKRKTRKRKS